MYTIAQSPMLTSYAQTQHPSYVHEAASSMCTGIDQCVVMCCTKPVHTPSRRCSASRTRAHRATTRCACHQRSPWLLGRPVLFLFEMGSPASATLSTWSRRPSASGRIFSPARGLIFSAAPVAAGAVAAVAAGPKHFRGLEGKDSLLPLGSAVAATAAPDRPWPPGEGTLRAICCLLKRRGSFSLQPM